MRSPGKCFGKPRREITSLVYAQTRDKTEYMFEDCENLFKFDGKTLDFSVIGFPSWKDEVLIIMIKALL